MTSAEPVRLAIFVPHKGMSGAETNIANLLRQLSPKQFDICLFAPADQPLVKAARAQGYHTYEYCNAPFLSLSIEIGQRRVLNPVAAFYDLLTVARGALRLSRFVNEQHIRVIYSGSMMAHMMAYFVRRTNRRVRLTIHLQELVASGLGRLLFRIVAQGADQVIAVSKAASAVLDRSRPVTVIYNGVDPGVFRANSSNILRDELHIPPDRSIIGVVGRLTPWKGHRVFLEAASLLIQKGVNSHFVIVGDAVDPVNGPTTYRATLENYCNRLNLGEYVSFAGHRKDIPDVMNSLDILVVPSVRPEPFGLVAAEAMACGKPVVVSNIGGLPEIVVDGVTGRLFDPGDPVTLSETLYTFIADPALRTRCGEAGRERVEACFTLDRYAAAMTEALIQAADID
jgi:glycosyltransferase involved in cell wall biosynthesis